MTDMQRPSRGACAAASAVHVSGDPMHNNWAWLDVAMLGSVRHVAGMLPCPLANAALPCNEVRIPSLGQKGTDSGVAGHGRYTLQASA